MKSRAFPYTHAQAALVSAKDLRQKDSKISGSQPRLVYLQVVHQTIS